MKPSSFHIFDASAGSGKTFTLVKEYLSILFRSNLRHPFKYILAITFTNKAVGEMKDRIIDSLKSFSSESILKNPTNMFSILCDELHLTPIELHNSSKIMLQNVVHNYAAFDVSTIDKFNQKLIRTFAFDLKLPLNFQVELDTEEVISQAVDNLIAKAGVNKELTKVLVDFAMEKIDDDKSWDVAYDFKQIAKLLINENDIDKVRLLNSKSLEDFRHLKAFLIKSINKVSSEIIKSSERVLELIEAHGLEQNDFSNGYLPKHFQNLANGKFHLNFKLKWQQSIQDEPLYPKRVDSEIAAIIDELQPDLFLYFKTTKERVFELKFFQAIYKNITPLSVLNVINKEVENLKEERNILLISEFNAIVSEHIKTQPAPFIYERIGEKFKHYFIDEFQDTSVLQWQNLIPLIGNALSAEGSSALIVGDAKQAIYRWRGGKAEQFIDLHNDKINPFQIPPEIKRLPINYRSSKHVIDFNNKFFQHLAGFAFSDASYKDLYESSFQDYYLKEEGYVNITFLDMNSDDDRNTVYPEEVLKTITSCLNNGFDEKDICVLVRYKKEGVAIADYLNLHSDINIISSETLLISRSPEINFIINILHLLSEPDNKTLKFNVSSYLIEHQIDVQDQHEFLRSLMDLDLVRMFKSFENYGIYFNYNDIIHLPIYESVEVIIHDFNLVKTTNGYIQYFLDFVLDYSQSQRSSLSGFLEYYNNKKEKLSVTTPDGINAVTIMTIHKAKGLEFPVVIFPYADLEIYRENKPKVWFPVNEEDFNGFSQLLINFNRDIEEFGESGKQLYDTHLSELELDNINLLYVALTRAIEQLHIISRLKLDKKGEENVRTFSGLFVNYLKKCQEWNDQQLSYEFGSSKKTISTSASLMKSQFQKTYVSTPKKDLNIKIVTNAGYLWDTSQEKAIEKGNIIHLILSFIKSEIDIDFAFDKLTSNGVLNDDQISQLKPMITSVVKHPKLTPYFNHDLKVYNEHDILLSNGQIVRPDRVVINAKNEAFVLDYKTGSFEESHLEQILGYTNAVEKLGFSVKNSILVYVNDIIEIKEV